MRFFRYYQKVNTWTFSDFLHEVTPVQKLKIEQNDFLVKRGPKRAPNEVFKFCEISVHITFLIFCMKLMQHEGLKLTQMTAFLRNLALGCFDKK